MNRSSFRAPWLALAAALALAGCSSPEERFYSLGAGMETPAPRAAGDAPAVSSASAAPAYYIEIPAVTVPQQVARSQLVVSKDDGRMDLLEQERWTSPPAAEIGLALSQVVTAKLGVVDVFRTPTPEGATIYRISTNVQRFESAPGRYALLDAVWSVRQVGSKQTLTCRTVAREAVSGGSHDYEALVAGHRRAVARLGDDIARAVQAMATATTAAGAGAACPA